MIPGQGHKSLFPLDCLKDAITVNTIRICLRFSQRQTQTREGKEVIQRLVCPATGADSPPKAENGLKEPRKLIFKALLRGRAHFLSTMESQRLSSGGLSLS